MKKPNLLIIDSAVNYSDSLLTGLKENTRVYTLTPHQDGIKQISNILQSQTYIANLEIVAHGEAGKINLGNSQLTLTNLQKYVKELSSWSHKIKGLLFHSCEVALGETGKIFVNNLSKILVEGEYLTLKT